MVWYSGTEFTMHVYERPAPYGFTIDEVSGNGDDVFDRGEVWDVMAPLGFLCMDAAGAGGGGTYCPSQSGGSALALRFAHNPHTDLTTVSFVFPLYNPLIDPSDPDGGREPYDYDPEGGASIAEIYWAYWNAAQSVTSDGSYLYIALSDWTCRTDLSLYLCPLHWPIYVLVGTSYETMPPAGNPIVFTGLAFADPHQPEVQLGIGGDFNGDGVVDDVDRALFDEHIAQFDGDPAWDADGDAINGSLTVPDFPMNFDLFDVNYDGVVDSRDRP